MKDNNVNHFLSYLTDIKIDERESTYCKQLQLYLRQGRYLLCAPNAVYSFDDLYHNFKDTFDALKLNNKSLGKVLVLGMGMGSIPTLLETVFNAQADYTLVELDPAVIELAQVYTLPKLKSSFKVIEADASQYVAECTEHFDLIAVDIFIDDTVPAAIESSTFLEQLKTCLKPNGRLLYNRLSHTDKTKKVTNEFIEQQFKLVFPKAGVLALRGNKMLSNMAY